MAAYILSNALFYIKDILPITTGTGWTFRISNDLERNLEIDTGWVQAYVLLKNSVQIERMLITADAGVATIVKRWLEQDGITENANLKKIWWDGSIGYISVKPDDFIALGKLDTAGGLRTTMQTNSDKNALFIAGRTKLPIINADFATWSGSTSTAAWIWTKSNWWYASWVWTWNASYDTWRLKLQTTAVSSYIEARTTDWGYNGITAESLPVEPNTTYTIEYDMETLYTSGSSTGGAKIAILFQTAAWVGDGEASPAFINTTTSNTHYTATFTTWPNTRYCNISPVLYGHMGTGTLLMSAWFDNIVVSCPSKELLKTITQKSSLSAEDEVFIENQDGTLSSVKYSVLQADMALAWGGSFVITPYEASITSGSPVGLSDDGLFLCTTENKSSANITASSIAVNLWQAQLDSTRTVFYYAVWVNTYARVGTLSGDVMTYGTEVNVWNGSSWTMSGAVVLINTDKVVFMYMDWSTGSTANLLVGTISGTTITLNVWTTIASSGNTRQIRSACKVRNDVFVINVYPNSTNGVWFLQFYTVSWTTLTPWSSVNAGIDWQYKFWPVIYLSDNRIGTYTQFINGTLTLIPTIYDINSGSTAITTTYTGANQWNADWYLARYSDDTYILTMTAINTNTQLVPKPPSGTTITLTTLFDNWASKFLPCITAWNNRFILIDGTTWYLYQEKTLVGSLTMSLTGPSYWAWTNHQFLSLYQSRIRFISGTNGTARIISFAIAMYFWVANNTTGWVLVRGTITKTWVIQGIMYYVQSDGSIWPAKTSKYIGKWIATNTLLVW